MRVNRERVKEMKGVCCHQYKDRNNSKLVRVQVFILKRKPGYDNSEIIKVVCVGRTRTAGFFSEVLGNVNENCSPMPRVKK